MSIDFATLQGLTIPEGVVTQITDAAGNVLWAVQTSEPVVFVLQVEKITSNTYAASTTYENEQFILLDIYPKTNGTVSVTYGGLTKTIKDTSGAAEPNAQQVYFGTFNGVSDSVTTPASGTLTIEGHCACVGTGSYSTTSKATENCKCVTGVVDISGMEKIPTKAFYECENLRGTNIPGSVRSIGDYAFYECKNATGITIPDGVESIGSYVFWNCRSMGDITIAASVKSIGTSAFHLTRAQSDGTYTRTITMLSATPPSQIDSSGAEPFSSDGNEKIIVPAGSGDAYKNAWPASADKIVEAS